MIKSLIVSGAVVTAAALASPVHAGPYVNVESNAGYDGWDQYLGSVTDLHVGYEGGSGPYGFYVQGGPAVVAPSGVDAEFELSGKVGGSVQASESLSVYGEVSFITTEDDPALGTKIGAKWNF